MFFTFLTRAYVTLFCSVFTRAMHSIARSLLRQRVRLSVCHIMSKRLNLSYNFFDHLVAPSFKLFWPLHRYPVQTYSLSEESSGAGFFTGWMPLLASN